MFYSTLLFAASALTGLVSAQSANSTYNTDAPPYTVTPSSVTALMRQQWCLGQRNTCPSVCGGGAYPNDCDPDTLTYTCTCTNGNTPNISDYQQSLPAQECLQWKADCVLAHPNDAIGQANCNLVTCGNKTLNELSSSSSSMMATTTSSGGAAATTVVPAGTDTATNTATVTTGAASSATASAGAAVANIAKNYGTGILATAMFGLFGLAL